MRCEMSFPTNQPSQYTLAPAQHLWQTGEKATKSTSSFPDRRRIAGLSEYARLHGWNLQTVEALKSAGQLKELIRIWKPDGFVVSCGAGFNRFPEKCFDGIPVVFSKHPDMTDAVKENCVFNDAKATVELGAKELLSLNLEYYAYIGWVKRTGWSVKREKTFESLMALHGRRVHVFKPSAHGCTSGELASHLAGWLVSLPHPIGILAVNDQIACRVASACRLAHLTIPDDVALIGIDNDEELCEGSDPTITSIDLDFTVSGRLAGKVLDHLMSNPNETPSHTVYPPLRLVRRKSSRRFAKHDAIVEKAVERIRREACEGLTADAVLQDFPCSRRMAEIRFRSILGRSILEEIRRIRLETAQILLMRTPTLGMDAIASRCGYGSLSAFSTFFRHETGQSPSAWRKENI